MKKVHKDESKIYLYDSSLCVKFDKTNINGQGNF